MLCRKAKACVLSERNHHAMKRYVLSALTAVCILALCSCTGGEMSTESARATSPVTDRVTDKVTDKATDKVTQAPESDMITSPVPGIMTDIANGAESVADFLFGADK